MASRFGFRCRFGFLFMRFRSGGGFRRFVGRFGRDAACGWCRCARFGYYGRKCFVVGRLRGLGVGIVGCPFFFIIDRWFYRYVDNECGAFHCVGAVGDCPVVFYHKVFHEVKPDSESTFLAVGERVEETFEPCEYGSAFLSGNADPIVDDLYFHVGSERCVGGTFGVVGNLKPHGYVPFRGRVFYCVEEQVVDNFFQFVGIIYRLYRLV